MYLSWKELTKVVGGGISGSLITALTGLATTLFEIGKAVGERLRALFS